MDIVTSSLGFRSVYRSMKYNVIYQFGKCIDIHLRQWYMLNWVDSTKYQCVHAILGGIDDDDLASSGSLTKLTKWYGLDEMPKLQQLSDLFQKIFPLDDAVPGQHPLCHELCRVAPYWLIINQRRFLSLAFDQRAEASRLRPPNLLAVRMLAARILIVPSQEVPRCFQIA
jgi:hypothetical protein